MASVKETPKLIKTVSQALNNAMNGGYAKWLIKTHDKEIAIDLQTCDHDCGQYTVEDLQPAVAFWKMTNHIKLINAANRE